MSQCRSYPFYPLIIKCHDTEVVQRQLNGSRTLLCRHLTGYRAIHLIGQPVFTGNSFQTQHINEVGLEAVFFIPDTGKIGVNSCVREHGLRRFTKEIFQFQVYRTFIGIHDEFQIFVVLHLPYFVHGSSFPFRHLLQPLHIFFPDHQPHTFL